MKENCIVYLVRTSEEDLTNLNKSLKLLDENLLKFSACTDVILFHEPSFAGYRQKVHELENGNVIFQQITFPEPPEGTPEIFPHPIPEQVAKGNLGFSIGYRHMCWFFSGGMYEQVIMGNYKYYLRLDTDSYILTPLKYDLFEFMENGKFKYGYIEEAIQIDNPAVVEGLFEYTGATISGLEEGKMYYTNFEVGEVDFFAKGFYHMFFKRICAHGGIYTKRWGDAPIKYIGVNLFMFDKQATPIKGFVYQHGAIYDLTK